jgi:hypothetical protein
MGGTAHISETVDFKMTRSVFSRGGGEGVAARDDGAEGVLSLVIGGFVDLGLALHAGGDLSGGVYLLVDGAGEDIGEGLEGG